MAEIDTSSYPKASLPVQQSPLDIAGKLGSMQQQAINIDKAKLDLMNTHFGLVNQELSTIIGDKSTTPEQAVQRLTTFGKMINLPAPVMQKMIGEFQGLKTPEDVQKQAQLTLMRGMDIQQKINLAAGQGGLTDTGQGLVPIVTQSPLRGGAMTRAPGYIQKQVPVTAESVDTREFLPDGRPNPNYMQKRYLGPQPEQTVQPSLPAQQAAPPAPSAAPARSALPVERPQMLPPGPVTDKRVTGPSTNFGGDIKSVVAEPATYGQPTGPAVGAPALYEEGKKSFASDQALATQKSTALKPLIEAYDLAKEVSTGAGTEVLNKGRAYLSNLGLIDANEKSPTVVYQMLNKNLAQFIDKFGSRSDADLAVKESGNANAKTQLQPALLHMVRKIIARERIDIARAGSFEGTNYSKYGEHSSKFPTSQDERAYEIDKMPVDEARKLYNDMKQKALNGNSEGIKFLKSLQTAKKQGLVSGINQ